VAIKEFTICAKCTNVHQSTDKGDPKCIAGKNNAEHRDPVTGYYLMKSLPYCKAVNTDGQCKNYQEAKK